MNFKTSNPMLIWHFPSEWIIFSWSRAMTHNIGIMAAACQSSEITVFLKKGPFLSQYHKISKKWRLRLASWTLTFLINMLILPIIALNWILNSLKQVEIFFRVLLVFYISVKPLHFNVRNGKKFWPNILYKYKLHIVRLENWTFPKDFLHTSHLRERWHFQSWLLNQE